jgi:hypothetical protein
VGHSLMMEGGEGKEKPVYVVFFVNEVLLSHD